jgi:hypothetical protein
MPIVDVPGLHQSRRHLGVRHGSWSRATRVAGARSSSAGPGGTGSTRCFLRIASGKHLTVDATSSPSSEGTKRDEPAQVGRVYPKPPAAFRSGMRMGSETPEQHQHPYSFSLPFHRIFSMLTGFFSKYRIFRYLLPDFSPFLIRVRSNAFGFGCLELRRGAGSSLRGLIRGCAWDEDCDGAGIVGWSGERKGEREARGGKGGGREGEGRGKGGG